MNKMLNLDFIKITYISYKIMLFYFSSEIAFGINAKSFNVNGDYIIDITRVINNNISKRWRSIKSNENISSQIKAIYKSVISYASMIK